MNTLRYQLSDRQCRILQLALKKLTPADADHYEFSPSEVANLQRKLHPTKTNAARLEAS